MKGLHSVGIIGGGAWGTALAQLVASKTQAKVPLWVRDSTLADAINQNHINNIYLSDVYLNNNVYALVNYKDIPACSCLLVAVPAQHMRATLIGLLPTLDAATTLVLCAKGIEASSGLFMHEVIAELMPNQSVAVLSGPSFAGEVVRGLPTATTLACTDQSLGEMLVQQLGHDHFRPYWSADVIGAEIGGAIKNVLAIACGIATGRRLGENARAALITRGLAEMMRFGVAKGAQAPTLMGLSGLGDLVLTCSSTASRNMLFGTRLGQGVSVEAVRRETRSVVEGDATAPVLMRLTRQLGVEMPICAAVAAILAGADVSATIEALIARPYRPEQQ